MFRSVQLRIVACAALVAAVVCGAISGTLYLYAGEFLAFMIDQGLRESLAEHCVQQGFELPTGLAGINTGIGLSRQNAGTVQILQASLPLDNQVGLGEQASIRAASMNGSDLRTTLNAQGETTRILTQRLQMSYGEGYLQASQVLTRKFSLLRQLASVLIVASTLIVVVITLATWCLAGICLRPIQQAWQLQQTTIANINHELRIPLTLIQANSDVALQLLEGDQKLRHFVEDTRYEAKHMTKIINDLSLLYALDNKQILLDLKAIPIQDLLTSLREHISALASQRGITIKLDWTGGMVWADESRLRQILLNVVDNAMRHTPRGGVIRLGAKVFNNKVVIVIGDSGDGIPPDALPHIFQRFYHAENNQRTSGLGLSIAASLIALHNGHIEITSALGLGTNVTITLPAVTQSSRQHRIRPAPSALI